MPVWRWLILVTCWHRGIGFRRRRSKSMTSCAGPPRLTAPGIAPDCAWAAKAPAEKLDAVGALVEYYEVPAVDHGYNIMSNALEATRRTYARIAEHVVHASG